ncbi:hypothetical protein [Dictyobacter vulcani]|uniref:hypothetical protein n=1 Tax=Dictyobacter vulcani TaxID=2607529 RepID=UPI0012507FC7|nr:hypothetical protein [Dictyobacter vulcani]
MAYRQATATQRHALAAAPVARTDKPRHHPRDRGHRHDVRRVPIGRREGAAASACRCEQGVVYTQNRSQP